MQKIILTEDLVLTAENLTPGYGGELLIEQDNIGNHRIILGERNIGFVQVLKQPGTITLLTWRNDDKATYWNMQALTPEVIVAPPDAVTDLRAINIDSINVKLRWTAPNGNRNGEIAQAVDRYYLYYSNAPITPDLNVAELKRFDTVPVPAAAGAVETLILTNLKPNTYYAFVLTSEKVIFGKLRTSGISNILQVHTKSLNADITTPEWIPVDGSKAYINGRWDFTQEHTSDLDLDFRDNVKYTAKWITDYSKVTNTGGKLSGQPDNYMEVSAYGAFWPDRYNTPAIRVVFPLDAEYTVDKFYFLGVLGINFKFKIYFSPDGSNWQLGCDSDSSTDDKTNPDNWAAFDVLPAAKVGARYFALDVPTQYFKILGMAIFGKKTNNTGLTGAKFKRLSAAKAYDDAIGTNSIGMIEDLENMVYVGKVNRYYQIFNWFFNPGGNLYQAGGNTDITKLYMQFNTSRMWPMDDQLQKMKNLGLTPHIVINDELDFLAPSGMAKSDHRKSVNAGLNHNDLSVTLDYRNWTFLARCVYMMVARWGNNPDADQSYFSLWPGKPDLPESDPQHFAEQPKAGLGLVSTWEIGNELDAYWWGDIGYYTPEEMAMRMSVCYDGHNGAMGAGFGMKAADPTAKLIMPGNASTNLGYFIGMLKWWDANRGKGDYPIDAINFHFYNSNYFSQNFEVFDYTINPYGVQPEWASQRQVFKEWIEYRDANCPKLEIWVTEMGYDQHQDGVYAPDIADLVTRHVTKAQWLIRSFAISQAWGVDRVMQYFFRHQHPADVFDDNNPVLNARDPFITSGYLVPKNSGEYWQSVPTEAWWYMSAFRKEIDGYKVQHLLSEYGKSTADANPIQTFVPELFGIAYKNAAGEGMVMLWLAPIAQAASLNAQRSEQITINVASTEVKNTVIDFINSHITKTKAGHYADIIGSLAGDQRSIVVTVTETPLLIKTANIGKPRLIDPQNFNVIALTPTSLQATWLDKNIGMNNTKIYLSNLPDQGFENIYSGYIDNAEYILNDLQEGLQYYMKIVFELNGVLSNESAVYGLQLGKTLPVPQNFRLVKAYANKITLAWDFPFTVDFLGFQVYRSLQADGVYERVATLATNVNQFTDIGLLYSTNYFYKIRAVDQYDTSLYSFTLAVTTSEASQNPPVVQAAKTKFSGDAAILTWSLPMANIGGNAANFNVIEFINGDPNQPRLMNVTDVQPGINDDQIILQFERVADSEASTFTIGYDGNLGTLSSIFDVKAQSFNAYPLENHLNDATLIDKIFQFNVFNAHDEEVPNIPGWNSVRAVYTPPPVNYYEWLHLPVWQQPTGQPASIKQHMIDKDGNTHTYNHVIDDGVHQPITIVHDQYLLQAPQAGAKFELDGGAGGNASYFTEIQADKAGNFTKYFPVEVLRSGDFITQQDYNMWTEFWFQYANTARAYNIKIAVMRSDIDVQVELRINRSNSTKVYNIKAGNSGESGYIYITDIKAIAQDLKQSEDFNNNDAFGFYEPNNRWTEPMISFSLRALPAYGHVVISGFIIEEVYV